MASLAHSQHVARRDAQPDSPVVEDFRAASLTQDAITAHTLPTQHTALTHASTQIPIPIALAIYVYMNGSDVTSVFDTRMPSEERREILNKHLAKTRVTADHRREMLSLPSHFDPRSVG